jgi:hypothetical protein
MSTILFSAGLLLLVVGVYQVVLGGQGEEVWGVLLGGVGGATSLAATFWTEPLKKITDSISDLVKLEAAFLGYIRVIGELDSAFQMQYLDILSGKKDSVPLDRVMADTTGQVQNIMTHTIELIDKHVAGSGSALKEMDKQIKELAKELEKLKAAPSGQ